MLLQKAERPDGRCPLDPLLASPKKGNARALVQALDRHETSNGHGAVRRLFNGLVARAVYCALPECLVSAFTWLKGRNQREAWSGELVSVLISEEGGRWIRAAVAHDPARQAVEDFIVTELQASVDSVAAISERHHTEFMTQLLVDLRRVRWRFSDSNEALLRALCQGGLLHEKYAQVLACLLAASDSKHDLGVSNLVAMDEAQHLLYEALSSTLTQLEATLAYLKNSIASMPEALQKNALKEVNDGMQASYSALQDQAATLPDAVQQQFASRIRAMTEACQYPPQ